jgi:threonine dehydratase
VIGLDDIREARKSHRGKLEPTPIFPARALSGDGRQVWLKAENLQPTGSFKIRGALHRVSRLGEDERRRGVVAASAGNHAQGVAMAASLEGVPATIVMPADSPVIKMEQTRSHGADVQFVDGGIEEAVALAMELRREKGLTFVHPFDDPLIQAGQGTAGLEILEGRPDVEAIVVPVGGGGLIAGISVAVKEQNPDVRIFGVQAEGADPASRSLADGRRVRLKIASTMADGIRVREVADSTFQVMRRHVESVVTVSDEEISRAMVHLLERSKLVVEGAGAAGVAALLAGRLPPDLGRTVVVLSGGNADTNLLSRVIQRGLTAAGRYVQIQVQIPDRPGYLRKILAVVAERRANILDINHDRSGWRVPLGDVQVELLLETRDPAHGREILTALESLGMPSKLWGRDAYRRQRRRPLPLI